MTINGPAPIILAMYVAAANVGSVQKSSRNLRGTVQADILKEVQAQNEMIFPDRGVAAIPHRHGRVHDAANMPRWYPISISGYHIAEAGATPVQQAAYTLSNGFAYVEDVRRARNPGRSIRAAPFVLSRLRTRRRIPRALARVAAIWAIGMRDVFGAGPRAQLFKLHTQTSGRSLIAAEFKNNLTRTAVELMLVVHERDEFVPHQQRRRTVHHAE